MGYGQYMLLQLMHESIHQVFTKPSFKSFLMAVFHNFSLGVGRSYSELHMDHHRYFGEAKKDPDYPTYIEYPKSKLHFLSVLLKHLSGYKALKQLITWQKKPSSRYKWDKLNVIILQLSLLMMAYQLGQAWAYFIFWAFPLMSVVKVLGYLRIIVEHGAPNEQVALRSLRGNALICNILGPYGFQYHAEHHKVPNLPYAKLKAQEGVEVYEGNHFTYLWIMFWRLP